MELQNLTEIFNNKIFRIPDYQRGFAWGELQLDDLWRDLEVLENDEPHYTGMLSVNKKEDNVHYIIDGQQRLTALITLIQVISKQLVERKQDWVNGKELADYIKTFLYKKTGRQGEITKTIFGYETDNPSHIYFETRILDLTSTDGSTPEHTLYTQNLKFSKEFFEQKTERFALEDFETLLKKITENLKFNFYQIGNELNIFIAFETMNNRGKPLSTLELLKNRLIYLSTLIPDHDEKEKAALRRNINESWKTIYEFLGKNPDSIIEDDDFLKDHWIMKFEYDRKTSNVYKDFLLGKHFTRKRLCGGKLKYQDIKNYVVDIQESVKHYYYIHNPSDAPHTYSNDAKKWLSKLNRLRFATFKPLITVLFKETSGSTIIKTLKKIERFIFVAYRIRHARSNYQNSHFYRWAKCLNDYPNKIDDLLNDDVFSNDGDLVDDFIYGIKKKEEQFYKWGGINYFLYEYELFLQEKWKNSATKIEWGNINAESIEHIYPKVAKDKCWQDNFIDQNLLHDLGNLLLLSTSANATLQNKCFDIKKNNFSMGSYSAIEVSRYTDWTPTEIGERRKKMLDFMDKRWNIVISDEFINKIDQLHTKLSEQKHI